MMFEKKPPHPALSPNSFAIALPCHTTRKHANELGEREHQPQNAQLQKPQATTSPEAVACGSGLNKIADCAY
jgi:hypothetical protein